MDDIALAAARRALKSWSLDVTHIEPVSHSENIVFRVQDRSGLAYVLRLHRPTYHNLDELNSEQLWTAALIEAGIDVPVATLTTTGDGYAETVLEGEHRYAGVLEWVDGETLGSLIESSNDRAFIAARYKDLGRLMANIHEQASVWPIPHGFTRHSLDANGLMGDTPFWGRFWESPQVSRTQRKWLKTVRDRIHAILLGYGKSPQTYSLIHADLHPGNIIVNGERLHIIDFDDSGFGWHQYDLAIAVIHNYEHPEFDMIRSSVIEGYRCVRILSDAALELLDLFLLNRALASIGWYAARPEHIESSHLTFMIDYVVDHAEEVVARFE